MKKNQPDLTKLSRLQRIRLLRSIFLGGEHAEAGSVHDVPNDLADDLIAQYSAVRLNIFARLWFRLAGGNKKQSGAVEPQVTLVDASVENFKGRKVMDRIEKANELIERGKRLGLRVEFQDGVNILRTTAGVDQEVLSSTLEQLATYLPEIREISQRRVIAALGKKHIGARIFSKENGAGTLIAAQEDGTLTISISKEFRRSYEEESRAAQMTIGSNAESLFVILDDEQVDPSTSHDHEPKPEQPRKGFLERLRRD